MGLPDERVIRIVPDRMVILNSREHAPFLLFVETLCPDGLQERNDEMNLVGARISFIFHLCIAGSFTPTSVFGRYCTTGTVSQ